MNKREIKKYCNPIIKNYEEGIQSIYTVLYKRLVDKVGIDLTIKNGKSLPLDYNELQIEPSSKASVDVYCITRYGEIAVYYNYNLNKWCYSTGGILYADTVYLNKYVTVNFRNQFNDMFLSLILGCINIDNFITAIDELKI